jgi:hypothetical protein
MRRFLLVLCLVLMPVAAMAQPSAPLAPAAGDYRWLAIGAGAVGGVVLLNVVTGGAALAPLMGGAGAAAVEGAGAAVAAGGAAAAAAARQAACRWAAIVSSAIAGGFIGNWMYGD